MAEAAGPELVRLASDSKPGDHARVIIRHKAQNDSAVVREVASILAALLLLRGQR